MERALPPPLTKPRPQASAHAQMSVSVLAEFFVSGSRRTWSGIKTLCCGFSISITVFLSLSPFVFSLSCSLLPLPSLAHYIHFLLSKWLPVLLKLTPAMVILAHSLDRSLFGLSYFHSKNHRQTERRPYGEIGKRKQDQRRKVKQIQVSWVGQNGSKKDIGQIAGCWTMVFSANSLQPCGWGSFKVAKWNGRGYNHSDPHNMGPI